MSTASGRQSVQPVQTISYGWSLWKISLSVAGITKHVWTSKFYLLPLTGRGITLYSINIYTGVSFTSSLLLASEQQLRLQLSRFLTYPISRDFRVSLIIEYIRSVLKKSGIITVTNHDLNTGVLSHTALCVTNISAMRISFLWLLTVSYSLYTQNCLYLCTFYIETNHSLFGF